MRSRLDETWLCGAAARIDSLLKDHGSISATGNLELQSDVAGHITIGSEACDNYEGAFGSVFYSM